MKVELDLYSHDELDAFGDFLKVVAKTQRARMKTDRETVAEPGEIAEADAAARAAGVNIDGTERRETVETEQPKRPRGRPRKDATVADLPADVVAEAKAAGVNVSDQPGGADVVAEQQAVTETVETEAEAPETKAEEVVTLTEQAVRDMIIDVLNAGQKANPDNPDIRTDILKPLLKTLGAEKISSIDPAKYAEVPALLEAIKAERGIE